jgi:hypothetical protein
MRETMMRTRIGLVLGLLLVLGLAGCGGGDVNNGLATANGNGAAASSGAGTDGLTDQERALKFAQCMRDNGVTDFPDPKGGGGLELNVPDGASPEKVQAAMQACKRYLPNGGEPIRVDPEQTERARRYAQCMRDNGVTNFPDPVEGGGIQLNGNDPSLRMDDPKFQAAQKACQNLLGGPSGTPDTQTRGNG